MVYTKAEVIVTKIKDLANRLGITQRAIRLYEEKGLLSPQRNIENGYRDYSEQEVWRLQTIASLRELGLGIQAIGELLPRMDGGDTATVHHYLELQRMAFTTRWVELKSAITCLDEVIGKLEEQDTASFPDHLFRLADDLKQRQSSRSLWKDRWGFDRIAKDYDQSAAALAAGPRISGQDYEAALSFMVQWIAAQPGEQGLDIGTGTGNLAGRLCAQGASMSAIDQSKEMLALCRKKFPQISCKLGNALSIPFLDKQFHWVVSAFALHHLDAQQQLLALEEMNRVLKPNGRICLSGLMYTEAAPAQTMDKHPSNRAALLDWFRQRDYITVQHQLSEWLHVVYAVRKN